MKLEAWLEAYRHAWEERDAEAAAALFTEDACYRSHPFQHPHRGRDGVRAYWQGATQNQRDVRVELGRPFVDGNRVAVEWWATMTVEHGDFTIPGCLLLEFTEGGLCRDLREYWHSEPGRQYPFNGWGT